MSVSSKRARTDVPSNCTVEATRPCAPSACSTRVTVERSTFTAVRAADTCTAGDSPNRLGRAYSKPITSATAMIRYFQIGYLFMRSRP
ncbi:hypothetical protein D9M69_667650 [compost metagenome]